MTKTTMILDFLVASKDSQMVNDIKHSLDEHKVNFHSISNGNDLLNTILDNKYDLLFLDHQLDEMLGFDVLPIIKKARPKLPIIYIEEKDEFHSSKKIASSGVLVRLIKANDGGNNSFLQDIKEIITRYISKEWSGKNEFFKDE